MSSQTQIPLILRLDSFSLACVASFLDGNELIKLLRCGSHDLNHKLSQTVQNIDYTVVSPVYVRLSVIFAALQLGCHHLKSFTLRKDYPYKITCLETEIDWSWIGSSLKTLVLDLYQDVPALLTLNLIKNFPNLRNLGLINLPIATDWEKPVFPPRLESLRLTDFRPAPPHLFFASLPETLQSLHTWTSCTWTCRAMLNLRRLKSLHTFHHHLNFPPDKTLSAESWDFSFLPSSITDLKCSVNCAGWPSSLPNFAEHFPSLTSLETNTSSVYNKNTGRVAEFPPSLTHMKLENGRMDLDQLLPP